MYSTVEVATANMNMHAKDQQAASDHLQLIDEQLVAVAVVYLLLGPF